MSRYIYEDNLKEFISTHDYMLSDKWNSTDKGMFTCGIMQAIDEQTTADVRENVYGEWLHEQLIPNTIEGKMYGECSVCHKVRIVDNFCPNCGADMR